MTVSDGTMVLIRDSLCPSVLGRNNTYRLNLDAPMDPIEVAPSDGLY